MENRREICLVLVALAVICLHIHRRSQDCFKPSLSSARPKCLMLTSILFTQPFDNSRSQVEITKHGHVHAYVIIVMYICHFNCRTVNYAKSWTPFWTPNFFVWILYILVGLHG